MTVLALVGMGTVLGAATGPVLLVCVIAVAPWAWTRFSARTAPLPVGPAPDPDPAASGARLRTVEPDHVAGLRPAVSVPESLSTLGLCGQWQRSYFALAEATDALERDRIVALRRAYLDELERRDPEAVARWLTADARPAGTSPARHLGPAGAGSGADILSPTHRPATSAGTDPLPGVKP